LLPAQLHDHGPEPLTVEAAPELQRLVGVEAMVCPLDEPHVPFTGGGKSCAEQEAVVPPLEPAQLQLHGPVPETVEAVPVLHRLVVGADGRVMPLEEPQAPFTGGGLSCAEQVAVVPPLEPEQLQDQGPEPLTAEAVPVLHRLVGVDARVCSFELPQAPFVGAGLQLALPVSTVLLIGLPCAVSAPLVQRYVCVTVVVVGCVPPLGH